LFLSILTLFDGDKISIIIRSE